MAKTSFISLADTARMALFCGAVFAALAVCFGAFGAHQLKQVLDVGAMGVYHTAVAYQFYHSFALILLGLLGLHCRPSFCLSLSCYLFIVGILLFSGSLYLLALFSWRWVGMLTPLGGVSFIVGWCCFAKAALDHQRG